MAKKIYVTGRACRLPGAPDVDALKGVLFGNVDTVSQVPRDRWLPEYFLHPVPGTKGKTYTFAAGIVDDLWSFDASVFGISPREAGQMDPQQRLLLQVAWEALEDAGIAPDSLAGKHVGVYVGCSAMAYASRLSQDSAVTDAYLMTGNTLALVSNRISHVLDLRGPSMTIDTACSSSMFALKLAEDALKRGVIDTAIVAGVNAILDPIPYVGFSAARMLSITGRCQPFSAKADGYVRAEGAVAFVLERATRKGLGARKPYAAVVGVETNTDGRTLNVALPSVEGQSDLLRRIYARCGVDPNDLAFVEAHGTGTMAGDPVEAMALGEVLGKHCKEPLLIGSIKSNIGHLEPASGVAGLLKALLALEHGSYPASLHAETLNPNIPFTELNLAVARSNVELPTKTGTRLAGVNSFGFGGANAHAIVEEVPDEPDLAPRRRPASAAPILFMSAFGPESLRKSLAAYEALVQSETSPAGLSDLCSQAAAFRGRFPHRAAIICDTTEAAVTALGLAGRGVSTPRVLEARTQLRDAPAAFVFSGNGSQFPGMGLAALAADPAYARSLKRIDRAFAAVSGWSIIEKMRAPDLASALLDASVAQPLLFADQMAQVWALAERGLKPAAVMGHSGGEVAAACAAGALSLDQAIHLLVERSRGQERLRGRGTMAAIQAPADEVAEAIVAFGGAVEIAAVNSPNSVTLVAQADQLDAFMRYARRDRRWPSVRLAIDYPYHGSAIDEVVGDLRIALGNLVPAQTSLPFISSVTGILCEGSELDADYWCANVRQPVAFMTAVRTLKDMGLRAFVEVGPTPVLTNYCFASLGDGAEVSVLHTFEKTDTADVNPILRAMARAMAHGVFIDLDRLLPVPRAMRRDLPRYQWNNSEVRIDRSPGVLNRYGNSDASHPCLGREEGIEAGVWLSELDQHMAPILCDHRVGGKVIVPGTVLVEMALAAAFNTIGSEKIELRDADLLAPIVLNRSSLTEIRTRVASEQASIRIGCRPRGTDGPIRTHFATRFYASVGAILEAAPDPARRAQDRNGQQLYLAARRIGLDYGPNFALVERFRTLAGGDVEVFIKESLPLGDVASPTLLDVIGADAALHGLIAAVEHTELSQNGMGFVPVRIGRMRLLQAWAKIASARVRVIRMGKRSILADVAIYDASGDGVALLEGVRFQAIQLVRDVSLTHHSFRQIVVPVRPAGAFAVLESAQALERLAEGLVPDDDSYFLVEAAAQSVAVEALGKLANPDGEIPRPARGDSHYFAAVVSIGLRADAIVPSAEGWRLTERAAELNAGELLERLRHEHPGLSSELVALAHLRETLADLLSGLRTSPSSTDHFGREILSSVSAGSIYAQRQADLLSRVVMGIAASWPAGRTLRIAELSDGSAQILPVLLRQLPARAAMMFDIVLPTLDEPGAAASLAIDRVTQIEVKPEALLAAGPFDLVVSTRMLNRLQTPQAVLKAVIPAMAAQGQFVAIEPAPSDFADLVHGVDPEWFDDLTAPDGPLTRLYLRDDLESLAIGAGLEQVNTVSLPDGCGGASALIGCSPAAVQDPGVAQSDALLAGAVAALLSRAEGAELNLPAQTALRLIVVPGAQPRFVVYFEPDCRSADPVAQMSARVLAMKTLFAEAQAKQGRLVCLVPGGTGQNGGQVLPEQAGIWAFLRTAANEFTALPIAAYDIAPSVSPDDAGSRVAACEARPWKETEIVLLADTDAAVRVMHGIGEAAHIETGGGEARSAFLMAPVVGGLDELRWHGALRKAPGPNEVEIAVAATGLNYRDVMWSMGLLPEEALEKGLAGPTIGIECSGTVIRCGSCVSRLKVGDKVLAFGPGCFASHLVVHEGMVSVLPDHMDLTAAATVPVAFFTAYYALVKLARLRRGQSVLIHGGAGGVGLAAIQIAQSIGVRVIATAGTPVKRSLLRANGVEDVLNSRSLDFAEGVMSLTDGRGVDAVLNSLAGEAMERSLNCLASFGHFLELGKLDFYANTGVGIRPLKENITYHGIDVDQLMAARPELAAESYQEVMAGFHDGSYRPLPFRAFDGVDAVAAFRLMQKSGHVGKIVVRPVAANTVAATGTLRKKHAPDPEGVHIIVGGLGGLGLEIAEWLVDAGARSVVLMGRGSEPTPEAADRIAVWRDVGAQIEIVSCDVADAIALGSALDTLRAKRRIAGVIHSAMVLDDKTISAVTTDTLAKTLPAKIAGAANLDRLTRGDRLDHFVLFSSMATLIGNHGQSTYVAANAFMEGIARRRRAEGLVGLAIGWGPITDVGYLARDKDKAGLVSRMSGNVEFSGLQVTRALESVLHMGTNADPVVHVSPMSWSSVSTTLHTLSTPTFRLMKLLGRRTEAESGDEDLRKLLIGLPFEKAERRLAAYLVGRIAHILQISEKAINETRPVTELGIDSLMGIELGLTLQESLGDDIPVTAVSDSYSIREISRRIVLHLHGGEHSDDGSAEAARFVQQHMISETENRQQLAEAAE